METHQSYKSKVGSGAQCSSCKNWISTDEDCVLLQPATVNSRGSASPNATAIHGVLCMECFRGLSCRN